MTSFTCCALVLVASPHDCPGLDEPSWIYRGTSSSFNSRLTGLASIWLGHGIHKAHRYVFRSTSANCTLADTYFYKWLNQHTLQRVKLEDIMLIYDRVVRLGMITFRIVKVLKARIRPRPTSTTSSTTNSRTCITNSSSTRIER